MMNSRQKENIAKSRALYTFALKGISVSVPVIDACDYDLIIDDNGLKRVQCKYTSRANKRKTGYSVSMRTISKSNNKGVVMKRYKDDSFDLLYVYCDNGDEYLIPMVELINIKSGIVVGKRAYSKFKI